MWLTCRSIIVRSRTAADSLRRRISCSAVRIGASGFRNSWPSMARNSSLARFAASASRLAFVSSVTSNATIAMPRHVSHIIEQRLIHEIEERLLRGAARTLDHHANRTADEWLAGLIHAVQQLVDALPLELRKRVSNGLALDGPSADEIQVLGVGKLKHVGGALQRGDADRRMREDARQSRRLRFFQRSHFGANELRVDTGDQLPRGERFHQVVIGAGVEPVNARLLARARGEQDERSRADRLICA